MSDLKTLSRARVYASKEMAAIYTLKESWYRMAELVLKDRNGNKIGAIETRPDGILDRKRPKRKRRGEYTSRPTPQRTRTETFLEKGIYSLSLSLSEGKSPLKSYGLLPCLIWVWNVNPLEGKKPFIAAVEFFVMQKDEPYQFISAY